MVMAFKCLKDLDLFGRCDFGGKEVSQTATRGAAKICTITFYGLSRTPLSMLPNWSEAGAILGRIGKIWEYRWLVKGSDEADREVDANLKRLRRSIREFDPTSI